jgi:carboxymethylenebutenolidase
MRLVTPEGDAPRPPSRRAVAASVFTAGYAVAAAAATAEPIVTPTDGLITQDVTLQGAGGYALPAYVARPTASGRKPAVVVVNEIFGIHAYIKDVCHRLAQAGYVAIAPDYFDRAGDPSTLADFSAIVAMVQTATHEQVMGDTAGALAWLTAQRFVRDRALGVTGFCWGGAVTWMAAARFPQIKAGVAWYGRLVPPPENSPWNEAGRPWPVTIAGALRTPVLGLYAENDQGIPLSTVTAMREALAAAGNPSRSEIVVYPGVQHGFHADYRESYNSDAARDGWSRMLAWFRAAGVE